MLSQPRKVNVGPLPEATQRNWLATLKTKEAEATAPSQDPAPTKLADASADQSPNSSLSPDKKYYAICTPSGKLWPNEFPVSQDREEDFEEEEAKDQDKEDNLSVNLDWEADLKGQDRKNQEIKDQKDNERKTLKNSL